MATEVQQTGRIGVGQPQEMATSTVTTPTDARRHGIPPRGMDVVPSSRFIEGRFGRMFRNLPIHEHAEESLRLLAFTMIAVPDAPQEQAGRLDKELGEPDDDENTSIPAGYTYLGQFIDHDITFDPVSSLQRQNDPDALHDFRTPRFDLDSLYGRGPSDQPYLYAPGDTNADGNRVPDGVKFLLGQLVDGDPAAPTAGPDLPRNILPPGPDGTPRGRALIGDPRNDENLIVSQLQSTFLRFHNAVVDHLLREPIMQELTADDLFKEAQRIVRWHYQWVVVHDFLRRICGRAVVDDVLGIGGDRGAFAVGGPVPEDDPTDAQLDGATEAHLSQPRLLFYHWENAPYMPVEFSVAAYRFGHSMVRPSYFFNDFVRAAHEAAHDDDPEHVRLRTPIFGPPGDVFANLNGFRPLPPKWGFEWKYFYPGLGDTDDGKPLPQPSYRIDTSLVNPLGMLPPEVAVNPPSLAERNLLRGLHMDLPSGQRVARAMGLAPMSDGDLELTADGLHARMQALRDNLRNNLGLDDAGVEQHIQQSLAAIDITDEDGAITAAAGDFAGEAPLWYYILHEAETQAGGHRLGPVGGRIVAEVLIGLLAGDPLSYLRVEPNWCPSAEALPLPAADADDFTMTDLVRFATGQGA